VDQVTAVKSYFEEHGECNGYVGGGYLLLTVLERFNKENDKLGGFKFLANGAVREP
jgi:hypothetical protein